MGLADDVLGGDRLALARVLSWLEEEDPRGDSVLSELFPTAIRYSGSSNAFNLAGIFGASLAPYIATWLASRYGLQYVGYYLTAAAMLTLAGLLAVPETKDSALAPRSVGPV